MENPMKNKIHLSGRTNVVCHTTFIHFQLLIQTDIELNPIDNESYLISHTLFLKAKSDIEGDISVPKTGRLVMAVIHRGSWTDCWNKAIQKEEAIIDSWNLDKGKYTLINKIYAVNKDMNGRISAMVGGRLKLYGKTMEEIQDVYSKVVERFG